MIFGKNMQTPLEVTVSFINEHIIEIVRRFSQIILKRFFENNFLVIYQCNFYFVITLMIFFFCLKGFYVVT
jgi:hypothetical protein